MLFSDFNLKVCCMGLLHCSDLNAVERFNQNCLPVLVGFILAGTIFLVWRFCSIAFANCFHYMQL